MPGIQTTIEKQGLTLYVEVNIYKSLPKNTGLPPGHRFPGSLTIRKVNFWQVRNLCKCWEPQLDKNSPKYIVLKVKSIGETFLTLFFWLQRNKLTEAFKNPTQDFLWISGENLILSPRYFTVLDLQTQGGLSGQLALSLQLFLMKKSALEIT